MKTFQSPVVWISFLSLFVIFACAHEPTKQTKPEPEGVAATEQATESEAMPPYPNAGRAMTVETLNGYEIHDPYRWMEDEDKAQAWLSEQNTYTKRYLEKLDYPGLKERLYDFFEIGYISSPTYGGDKLFYLKREGEAMEQSALFLLHEGKEKKLVDPNLLDAEKKTSLDWFTPSKDGAYLAYGLSKDGSENSILHILNVETGENLEDTIPNTRHATIEWTPDNKGFYYTRYPENDRYNRKAYFHKLGDDWKNDLGVFTKKRDKTHWTSFLLSDDGRHLFIIEHSGWQNCDLYLYDTKRKNLKTIALDIGAPVFDYAFNEGTLYLGTNLDAPNGKIVLVDLKKPEPKHWRTIIEQGKWPITDFALAKDLLVVNTLENVAAKLFIHGLTGERIAEIALPTLGMVEGVAEAVDTAKAAFVFQSFFHPPTLFEAELAFDKPKAKVIAKVSANIDTEAYTVKQISYPSFDGEKVNMFIVHTKGLSMNGDHQTLLYGYGGFNVNMSPYFSRRVMTWLDRGGVYAVANIRGGGEYGERWHKAGMLDKKFQCFADFEYAMRYLIRQGYTNPQRLVIEGGSNGGLLMGAMMTKAPHLFAAALGAVGLYDMIRYHRFPPGEIWQTEYGNADKPTDTGFLWGYSPYHQIIKGVDYPAFLGETADTDTRVHWMHTAKFVAALQWADTGGQPILFHIDHRQGHGMGKSKSLVKKEYLDKFKFMLSIVGDPAEDKEQATPSEDTEETGPE